MIRYSRAFLCLVAALIAVPFGNVAWAEEELPTIRSFSVEQLGSLGREIYVRDSYAARATDRLLRDYPDPAKANVSGWIVDLRGEGAVVRFFNLDGNGTASAVHDVIFANFEAAPSLTSAAGAPLSESEKQRIAARQLALGQVDKPCSPSYNTVVMEDPDRDGWIVYALASTTEPGIVGGGHYRISVSRDGTRVVEADRLSLSCFVIPPPEVPEGATPVSMYFTHFLSDTPIETHTLISLQSGFPLYVRTETGIWHVDGDKISFVEAAE